VRGYVTREVEARVVWEAGAAGLGDECFSGRDNGFCERDNIFLNKRQCSVQKRQFFSKSDWRRTRV